MPNMLGWDCRRSKFYENWPPQSFINAHLVSFYPEKLFELPCEWNYRVWLCSEVNRHIFWQHFPVIIKFLCFNWHKWALLHLRRRTNAQARRKMEFQFFTAMRSRLSRWASPFTTFALADSFFEIQCMVDKIRERAQLSVWNYQAAKTEDSFSSG